MKKSRPTPEPTNRRARLLETAQQLMRAKGYAATTIDEICAVTGVTKGAFFHYFADKPTLGKAALEEFMAAQQRRLQKSPLARETDPLKRVYGYVDFVIKLSRDPASRHGCLLGNFAQELSDTHHDFRDLCARHFSQWAAVLRRDLEAARIRHAPRVKFDAASLADHFIAVTEGALIMGKAKQDMRVVERSLKHFRSYLQSLFEKRVRQRVSAPNRKRLDNRQQ
ncbi:MAG: TetR/AcrR family transcriptional regulator [Sulfuricaulis sp.]